METRRRKWLCIATSSLFIGRCWTAWPCSPKYLRTNVQRTVEGHPENVNESLWKSQCGTMSDDFSMFLWARTRRFFIPFFSLWFHMTRYDPGWPSWMSDDKHGGSLKIDSGHRESGGTFFMRPCLTGQVVINQIISEFTQHRAEAPKRDYFHPGCFCFASSHNG